MFELFYHSIYTDGIDERSRFPRERYKLTKEALDRSDSDISFVEPKMAAIEDIYIAHERKYVDSFIAGRLSNKEKREIGLQPWNDHIVDRTRYIMGGSLGALKSAINSNGIAGTWLEAHTMPTTPEDQVIAYLMIWQFVQGLQKRLQNSDNVLIIDLDSSPG